MAFLIVAFVLDIIIFYTVYRHIIDTKATEGICVNCRTLARAMGGVGPRYSCTYKYSVNGNEYNADDVLKRVKKATIGTETIIYYKKDDPSKIITRDGIKGICIIALIGNVAAVIFVVLMNIIAY